MDEDTTVRITIEQEGDVTTRCGPDIPGALAQTLRCHRDHVPGSLLGMYRVMAETLANICCAGETEAGPDENRLYEAVHAYLVSQGVPGYIASPAAKGGRC